jgi:hypothetical protein
MQTTQIFEIKHKKSPSILSICESTTHTDAPRSPIKRSTFLGEYPKHFERVIQSKFSESPIRFPTSNFVKSQSQSIKPLHRFRSKIATLEKQINETQSQSPVKKNKFINLSELILPKLNAKENTLDPRRRSSLIQYSTAESEGFIIPKAKYAKSEKLKFSITASDAKFKQELMGASNTNILKKRIFKISEICNKQHDVYLLKCNKLKEYLQVGYKMIEDLKYE